MNLYVVMENIDDYPECGGGEYPDAVFFHRDNAEKYVERKQKEKVDERYSYYIQIWVTSDELN